MIVNKRYHSPLLYKVNKRNNYQVWCAIVEDNILKIMSYEQSYNRFNKRNYIKEYDNKETAINDLNKRYEEKRKKGFRNWNEINKDIST
ncbi:MAG TPA: hypothetical protein VI911_07295 [Patescibacteria group bacterium]|nr:hypothetical protein [Patescibacteria group bacterium]